MSHSLPTSPRARAASMTRLALAVRALVLVVALAGVSVVASGGANRAEANACNSGCLSRYNQCRISTNNSPSCGRQFQACVRRCLRR
ncbi:MAG: hypothetical protein AAGG99_09915 [Pseudomonadota bacterium]